MSRGIKCLIFNGCLAVRLEISVIEQFGPEIAMPLSDNNQSHSSILLFTQLQNEVESKNAATLTQL